MSNYLAIATVTATLSDILQEAASQVVPEANVTMRRPAATSDGLEKAAINLYLYQVTPNPAWRNVDVPTRNANGQVVQRSQIALPQVALDLYYLLSFHGSELEMIPQRLLGVTVVTLHTLPVLSPDRIREATNKRSLLSTSTLGDQMERVKLGPLNLNLEELSKLWSVFFQVPYTLSIAYRASVVLLEPPPPQLDIVTAKPVTTVHVKPPVISEFTNVEVEVP